MTDEYVRALAAEVPLSDAECREIGSVCRGWHETSAAENKAIRAVVARVLRGEDPPTTIRSDHWSVIDPLPADDACPACGHAPTKHAGFHLTETCRCPRTEEAKS